MLRRNTFPSGASIGDLSQSTGGWSQDRELGSLEFKSYGDLPGLERRELSMPYTDQMRSGLMEAEDGSTDTEDNELPFLTTSEERTTDSPWDSFCDSWIGTPWQFPSRVDSPTGDLDPFLSRRTWSPETGFLY